MIGVPELMILGFVALPVLATVAGLVWFWMKLRRRAKRFGYPTTRAYLRAIPQSDDEKRDAADLALKGLVGCVLGMMFPPLILVGLVPLYYGGRKFTYASMGLGLVDDPDQSRA